MKNGNTIDVIIVAGGSGSRLGSSVPKAFIQLGGKPLYAHSLDLFLKYSLTNNVIIVVPLDLIESTRTYIEIYSNKNILVVAGGKERSESVANGIKLVETKWMLIHDAARPFLTNNIIDTMLTLRNKYQCVVTAVPEVDTVRLVDGDKSIKTLDRSKLVRVGTPQLFNSELLKEALLKNALASSSVTDEAMLMEQEGIDVGIAVGSSKNFKITTPVDLEIAQALMDSEHNH